MTHTSIDQAQGREADQSAAGESVAGAATSFGESLSALVDSEASELEVRGILRQAESDPAVRERWKRYQLVHSVLQGDAPVDPSFDISARVNAAIAEEPQLTASSTGVGRIAQWRSGLGKAAVAATVAFAFVAGVQQLRLMDADQAGEAVAGAAESNGAQSAGVNAVPSGFELPPFAARTVSTDSRATAPMTPELIHRYSPAAGEARPQSHQAMQDHFDRLLLRHAERSSVGGSTMGLLPFARVSRLESGEERDAQE